MVRVKWRVRWCVILLAALGRAGGTAAEGDASDAPILLHPMVLRADAIYHLQGRSLDHPVGDGITLQGVRIPARLDAHGELQLDLERAGHFTAAHGVVAVSLPAPAPATGHRRLELWVTQDAERHWQYRTLTTVVFPLGPERLVALDADGDGSFNTPGHDALAWAGCDYAFPLPGPQARFCTRSLDLTGLTFGPLGEHASVRGRRLAAAVDAALPVLVGIDAVRAALGLTPRPADVGLSAALQKHCHYMADHHKLAHPEQSGDPDYSAEGNDAGLNSILGQGTPAPGLALEMMATLYHREDVIRPQTQAFGVGYEDSFGGIDGRRNLDGDASWPILVPPPDAHAVPLRFAPEMPDPLDGQRDAGYPITAYFDEDQLALSSWSLKQSLRGAVTEVPCVAFDSKVGGNLDMNRYERLVALIPRAPLVEGAAYRVSMTVDRPSGPWTSTWDFSTAAAKSSSATR
jgi:hypothetical protein